VEALLAAYNVPTPGSGLAPNIQQALALAETVSYPVALKLAASGLTHKRMWVVWR
jgi:acyl-CoA synthetase (NDP forming)